MGGGIGLAIAGRHTERLSRLVLVNHGGYRVRMPLAIRGMRLPGVRPVVRAGFGKWAVRGLPHQVYARPANLSPRMVNAYYQRLKGREALEAMVSCARQVDMPVIETLRPVFQNLALPVLILWGAEDTWLPDSIAQKTRGDFKNSALVYLPGCGHVAQEECPERVAEHVHRFAEGETAQDSPAPGPRPLGRRPRLLAGM
jgi:pimeloyl-ACP methyl ester carboxylesterase